MDRRIRHGESWGEAVSRLYGGVDPQKELASLRAENERLRGLLKIARFYVMGTKGAHAAAGRTESADHCASRLAEIDAALGGAGEGEKNAS